MNENLISRRYAKALVEICEDAETLRNAQRQMRLAADMLDPQRGDISVPELLTMLYGPRVPKDDKLQIADMLSDKMNFMDPVRNVVKTLIRRNRVGLIGRISDIFHALASDRRGVTPALVESACDLTYEEGQQLKDALELIAKGTVEVTNRVTPTLLGGTRIRIRGTMIDNSVAGALNRLEQRLTE